MKIIDNTGKNKGPYIDVVDATYLDDYRLLITFNDDNSRIVDFGDFLRVSSHPDIKKFLDIKNFKNFHIEYGDLMWGDFEMIFPIIELYRGKIEYSRPKRVALTLQSSNGKSKSIPSERRKLSRPQRAPRTV
jgi:hypothetical protein